MSDSKYSKQTFSFNLVPPKTQGEIETLEERDRSTVYSFFLIFFAVFIYFALTMLQSLVIAPRINKLNEDITRQEEQISTYSAVKATNGEVVTKSNVLSPVLQLDVGAIALINTSEELIQNIPGAQIVSYGREPSGEFVLTIILNTYTDASLLVENAQNQDNVSNVFLRQVTKRTENNTVESVIGLTLINEELNNESTSNVN